MDWLRKLSQSFVDTQYWGNQYHKDNPEHKPQFEVYQSPDFPHVFLGGEDDFDEAEAKAGQPICKIVDCRDMPEIEESSWDFATFTTIQTQFDSKVNDLIQKITNTNCPIFVHCALGANRSVSVLAAALAQLTGRPLNTILSDMKQVRHFVSPQDPYYLMALQQSPSETPQFKQQRFDELDQDFPLIQPGLPTNTAQIPETFPDDLLGDMNLQHEEQQWQRAVSTPGSLVSHDKQGWTGKVVELRGDPVNGGVVLVEHEFEGRPAQRFYPALELSPTMQLASPFRRASLNWLQKIAQVIPPWTQTWEEFIAYHKTGNISDGYGAEGQGLDLSHYNDHNQQNGAYSPAEHPILVDKKTFKVHQDEVEVEFRQAERENQYVKTTDPDETGFSDIVRDENGMATYYSPEEMTKRDLPAKDTTIYMFSSGLCIGHIGDSFGATELFVVREFQGGGIGPYALKLYMAANPSRGHNTPRLGQMTWQGVETAKKTWMMFVEDAIKNEKNVPENVAASYQEQKQNRVNNPSQRVDYDIPQHKIKKVQFSSSSIVPIDGFNTDLLLQMGVKFWNVENDQTNRPQRWSMDDGGTWENAKAFVENLGYQEEGYRTYSLKMDYKGEHGVILPANA